MATLSDSTVEGRPGLVLDKVLDVPCNNVNQGVDCRHVLSVQCLPVVPPELVLCDEHVGYLVLDALERGEGGEGDVTSDLLLHVRLLSPCSLSNHLHVGLLWLGVVVLDVLGCGEGSVQRSAVHVKLLSLIPSLHLHRDLLRLCVFVLEYVQGGGEYWQSQRTGSSRQSSQSRLSR